jgi:hypothetical protein
VQSTVNCIVCKAEFEIKNVIESVIRGGFYPMRCPFVTWTPRMLPFVLVMYTGNKDRRAGEQSGRWIHTRSHTLDTERRILVLLNTCSVFCLLTVLR